MQQTEPMAHLVHGRQAFVVPVHAAGRHRAGEDVAPVGRVVGLGELDGRAGRARPVRDVGGEGAVAEELLAGVGDAAGAAGAGVAGGQVRLEVDVQVGVAALAEGRLHAGIVGVGRPPVTHRPRRALEHEGDGRGGVRLLEGAELVRHHGGRDGVCLVGRADDVEVGVDGDLGRHAASAKAGRRRRVREVLVRRDEVRGRGRRATVTGGDIFGRRCGIVFRPRDGVGEGRRDEAEEEGKEGESEEQHVLRSLAQA